MGNRITTWANCYDDSWRGYIVDEAFAHPAKYARGLVNRIFDYLFANRMIHHGELVVDPFGGIGCGGIVAASRGVRWLGCELEEKFVGLAQQNFALHRRVWESAGDPLPVIVQGDSRKLRESLASADCVVSSPPFSDGTNGQPPTNRRHGAPVRSFIANQGGSDGCGDSPGNLAAMPPGSVDAILSSPPYSSGTIHDGGIDPKAFAEPKRAGGNCQATTMKDYGSTDGNLGNLPPGDVAAIVSSPPYEEGLGHGGTKPLPILVEKKLHSALGNNGYGGGPGNISNLVGETFWEAARDIVRECFAILKPGGVAVWVVKGFVRNKQLVDFPHDWQRLCEHCGFVMVEEIHASLVKESRNADLFGGEHVKRTERKSFFRRLAEKRGSPRIDHETVLVMRK